MKLHSEDYKKLKPQNEQNILMDFQAYNHCHENDFFPFVLKRKTKTTNSPMPFAPRQIRANFFRAFGDQKVAIIGQII